MRVLILPSFLVLSSLSGAQLGSVLDERAIGNLPPLPTSSGFGTCVVPLGDLNGDGSADLAVGAPFDVKGSVHVLFLDANGDVLGSRRIAEGDGRFVGSSGIQFGHGMTALGDLDGDGRVELAVLSTGLPNQSGRVHILFLNGDGSVRAQERFSTASPIFGGAMGASESLFGLCGFPDIDGDSVPELVLGDPENDAGVTDAGAVWVVRLNSDGTTKGAHRIAMGFGGFGGTLEASDDFGLAMAPIGDVNGDGNVDLVVSDNHFSGQTFGRMWVLLLDAAAQVIGEHATSADDMALSWESSPGFVRRAYLGGAFALSDLDGDGVRELAVGTDYRSGSMAVTFLAPDGSLRKRLPVANGEGGLALDSNRPRLFARASLGLDGLGQPRVVVQEGETLAVLTLAASAVRNGSGVNPQILAQNAEPRIGRLWRLDLDCSGHAAGLAFFLLSDAPLSGTPTAFGELLVDPARMLLVLGRDHGGNVARQFIGLPPDLALVNRVVHVQGACGGAPGFTLSNALAVQIGR